METMIECKVVVWYAWTGCWWYIFWSFVAKESFTSIFILNPHFEFCFPFKIAFYEWVYISVQMNV
jgi:hypothetical protein